MIAVGQRLELVEVGGHTDSADATGHLVGRKGVHIEAAVRVRTERCTWYRGVECECVVPEWRDIARRAARMLVPHGGAVGVEDHRVRRGSCRREIARQVPSRSRRTVLRMLRDVERGKVVWQAADPVVSALTSDVGGPN